VSAPEEPPLTQGQQDVQDAWDGVGQLEDMYNKFKEPCKLVKHLCDAEKLAGAAAAELDPGKSMSKTAKAGRLKSWTDLAPAAFEGIAEVLVDKEKNPLLAGGLKIGAKALGAMAQGKGVLSAALMATVGVGAELACDNHEALGMKEKDCTGKDCLEVVGNVETGARIGGAAGGFAAGVGAVPGAIVGGGLGLLKSAVTGELGRCAKGLYKRLVPDSVKKNIEAAYRTGKKFVSKVGKFFVDMVPEPVKRVVGKVLDGAKKVVDFGRRVITSAVQGGRTLINAGVRTLANVGRTVTNAAYRGAKAVGSWVRDSATDFYKKASAAKAALGRSFNAGVDYVGRKMYETYDSAKRAVSYAGRTLYNGGKRVVEAVGSAARSVGRTVVNTGYAPIAVLFFVCELSVQLHPNGINSISPAHLHVRVAPMWALSTCR